MSNLKREKASNAKIGKMETIWTVCTLINAIFMDAELPNDFSALWFIGYQSTIHRHKPLLSSLVHRRIDIDIRKDVYVLFMTKTKLYFSEYTFMIIGYWNWWWEDGESCFPCIRGKLWPFDIKMRSDDCMCFFLNLKHQLNQD